MVALSHQSLCRADAASRQTLDGRRRRAVEWRAEGGGMEGGGRRAVEWRAVDGGGPWRALGAGWRKDHGACTTHLGFMAR